MSNESEKNFLGIGWSFPPTFDADTASLQMVKNETDIEESLQILLTTIQGERVMQPKYGCDLTPLLFEPVNTSFRTQLADRIKTAILIYEPRIDAKRIGLTSGEETEGIVTVEIEYVVRSTNSRYNFVYPFYRIEGTQVKS